MAHSSRCENATGPICKCKCGGTLHGKGPKGGWQHLPRGCRYLGFPMGGAVEQIIKQFFGEQFTCTCSQTMEIREFVGCPDNFGYPDRKGAKWAIYVICPQCGHWWALWEIPIRCYIRLAPEPKRSLIVLRSYVEECMPRFELREEEDYFLLIDRECPMSEGISADRQVCSEIVEALECFVEWITGQKHGIEEVECRAMGHPADVFKIEKAVIENK